LQTLYNLGFRRVSFGVQDYSEKVQTSIHRIQPFHNVAKVTFWAKEIGYTSISHDLVFGLPFQTLENIIDTIEKTNSLSPSRLAFYSYGLKVTGNAVLKMKMCRKMRRNENFMKLEKRFCPKKAITKLGWITLP
jgi:oxygen-independent coproporphyrinogen-3 oxidase